MISAGADQALWRSASRALSERGIETVLAGWAGPARVTTGERPALTFLAASDVRPTGTLRFAPIEHVRQTLDGQADRGTLDSALANLAPVRT